MSTSLLIILAAVFILVIITSALIPKSKGRKNTNSDIEKNTNNDVEIVSNTIFKKQKLLNNEEVLIYNAIIKNIIIPNKGKYRIFAQVNLGEILSCRKPAYWKINTKRVDFCITANDFSPLAVVEYHGTGHNGNNHEIRDKVKQIAVEKAGLIYFAINENERDQADNLMKKLMEQIE